MSRVFISHAGTDSESAARVARMLNDAGVEALLDREQLSLGESFLSFMETALQTSDYCLLLWSRSAAASKWVTVEWESALVHSVGKNRGFLITARLEDVDVPMLLKPRLFVDLFPNLAVGVRRIVESWRMDRKVEAVSNKAVASSAACLPNADNGTSFYVTSRLFAFTVPIVLSPTLPIAACIEQIVSQLRLPKKLQHEERVGVTFHYVFALGGRSLQLNATLADEGVPENALLNLLVEVTPFAADVPILGSLGSAVLRGGTRAAPDDRTFDDATVAAQALLRAALVDAGLALPR